VSEKSFVIYDTNSHSRRDLVWTLFIDPYHNLVLLNLMGTFETGACTDILIFLYFDLTANVNS
jgi:hypothetical protein